MECLHLYKYDLSCIIISMSKVWSFSGASTELTPFPGLAPFTIGFGRPYHRYAFFVPGGSAGGGGVTSIDAGGTPSAGQFGGARSHETPHLPGDPDLIFTQVNVRDVGRRPASKKRSAFIYEKVVEAPIRADPPSIKKLAKEAASNAKLRRENPPDVLIPGRSTQSGADIWGLKHKTFHVL